MTGPEADSGHPMDRGPRCPRLLAISDRHLLVGRSWVDWLEELADAEVDAVQIREKDLPAQDLLALARKVVDAPRRPRWVMVNGRLDVAVASGAAGAHLPSAGLPTAALRRRFGKEPVFGRSTHTLEEVVAERQVGVDFVTFGPVWETPSKRVYGAPPGLDGLHRAARVGVPVVALGGVDGERLEAAVAAGAMGAAGIRVFYDRRALARLAAVSRRLDWNGSRPRPGPGG